MKVHHHSLPNKVYTQNNNKNKMNHFFLSQNAVCSWDSLGTISWRVWESNTICLIQDKFDFCHFFPLKMFNKCNFVHNCFSSLLLPYLTYPSVCSFITHGRGHILKITLLRRIAFERARNYFNTNSNWIIKLVLSYINYSGLRAVLIRPVLSTRQRVPMMCATP